MTIALAVTTMLLAPLAAHARTAGPMQASVRVCVACHGVRGQGTSAGAPRLAGQNPEYMAHALSMFKDGTRKGPIMHAVAAGLSDAQMRALAFYFAQQKVPIVRAGAALSPLLQSAGQQLAVAGAPRVTACFSCHAADGAGNGARYPRIAGEPAQFVIDRIHEFQARARNAVPQPGTMTAVAATMDESQVQASAAYLSQLGGG